MLVRRLAGELDTHPDGFDLHLGDAAQSLGLGLRGGLTGPFFRAIARTGQFGLTRSVGPAALAVRGRVQTLTHHQLQRLPAPLRDEHDTWVAKTQSQPDMADRMRRARRLALSLLELGEPAEAAELQLHRWEIHPAVAHEALRWATARRLQPAQGPVRTQTFDPTGDAA